MKKHTTLLLGVAIALGLLVVHSQAKEVRLDNKEIIGEWCNYEYKKEVSLSWRGPEEDCGDGILKIKVNAIEGWEHGCTYTSVKTWYDPTIPTATKTPTGALVSRIEMTVAVRVAPGENG